MVACESGGDLRAARAQPRAGVIPKGEWLALYLGPLGGDHGNVVSVVSALDHAGPWGSAAPASDLGWRSAGSPVRKSWWGCPEPRGGSDQRPSARPGRRGTEGPRDEIPDHDVRRYWRRHAGPLGGVDRWHARAADEAGH